MKESQTIEWKSNWRDECLKDISAFSNTNGGKLFLGVDDAGKIVGIENTEKLLEDIHNKTINYLGIIVDVHLREKEGKTYLEVTVPPSSIPISYKGIYYIRSGSTKQELKGV